MFRNTSTLSGRLEGVSNGKVTARGTEYRDFTISQDLADGASRLVRFRLFGKRCAELHQQAKLGNHLLLKGKIKPNGNQVHTAYNMGNAIPWPYDRNDGEIDGVVTSIYKDGEDAFLDMEHTSSRGKHTFKFWLSADVEAQIDEICEVGDRILALGHFNFKLGFTLTHILTEFGLPDTKYLDERNVA